MIASMQRFRLAKAKPTHISVGSATDRSSVGAQFYFLAAETNPRRPVPEAITLSQIQLKPVTCRVRLPDCMSAGLPDQLQPQHQAAQFIYENRNQRRPCLQTRKA